MRTVILLGAGASADAGLPLTNQLAQKLKARFNEMRYREDERAALNYVFGAMQGYGSRRGEDPESVVDVEKLISAVRLLADRADHEAAPFVQWERPVGALDVGDNHYSLATRIESAIEDAIREGPDGSVDGDEIVDAVREIVDLRTGIGGSGAVYRRLEKELREQIARLLAVEVRTSYLNSLIELARDQPHGLDVVTLNYDLTVERAASKLGVRPERAIESWRPGSDLDFTQRDGVLNLIKLHGSIDWVNDVIPQDDGVLPQRITRPRRSQESDEYDGPAIVIGNREKLETAGATLALFRAFQIALRRADRLVIVGYSGGDTHVNAELRDWVNANTQRTITILDPFWTTDHRQDRTFAEELNKHLGTGPVPRLRIIRGTAEQALAHALSALPEPEPDDWFSVAAAFRDEWTDVTLSSLGRDLSSIRIRAGHVEDARSNNPSVEIVFDDAFTATLAWLGPNESVTVSFQYQNAAVAVEAWAVAVSARGHLSDVVQRLGPGAGDLPRSAPGQP